MRRTRRLSIAFQRTPGRAVATRAALRALLASDLSFQGHDTSAQSHDFHAFPAKFPPQLPSAFINALTADGARVLDPMYGFGNLCRRSLDAKRGASLQRYYSEMVRVVGQSYSVLKPGGATRFSSSVRRSCAALTRWRHSVWANSAWCAALN